MAICTEVTVFSRYPEDSNIIDFIDVKMMQLYEDYSASGNYNHADACWRALDSYVSGTVDIIFKRGEPYVINREKSDTTIIEEDDLT